MNSQTSVNSGRIGLKVKIVVFDMDGVLVDVKSSWQYVHEAFDTSNEENLRRYVNREISYKELLRRDIMLWGKIHVNKIKAILAQIPPMQGAKQTIDTLKKAGCKTAIISAGIALLADQLQRKLEIDYSFANTVLTDQNGILTGEGKEVVNLLNKIDIFRRLAIMEKTSTSNCAVVGDSVYDIPLFREAGLSIAFNTDDPRVKKAADFTVKDKDLTKILAYFTRPCHANT